MRRLELAGIVAAGALVAILVLSLLGVDVAAIYGLRPRPKPEQTMEAVLASIDDLEPMDPRHRKVLTDEAVAYFMQARPRDGENGGAK